METLAFFWEDTVPIKFRSNESWMFEFLGGLTGALQVFRVTTARNCCITSTQSLSPSRHCQNWEQWKSSQRLTYWDGAWWCWWPRYRRWVRTHPFHERNHINETIPGKDRKQQACTWMTQRFQQSIWPRRHRLLPIVDLDSQHGLDVVILGMFTRGHCEEDSCLAFVEGRKKVLV